MATIRLLLGIICLGIAGGHSLLKRDDLSKLEIAHRQETMNRQRLVSIARSQLGVRESSGRNDGKDVVAYLHYAGSVVGQPWCAAFISWVFGQCGYPQPQTPWSPALFPLNKRIQRIQAGNIYGIYNLHLKRIAHCGLIEQKDGNWIIGIEGNTNSTGSREGDGVYRKRRHLKQIRYFADWIKRERGSL